MTTVEFIRLLTKSQEQIRLSAALMRELVELIEQKSLPPNSHIQLLVEELSNNIVDTKNLIQESKKYRA